MEAATATDQFVAAARIRFGPVRLQRVPLLLVRTQFGFAESLVSLSQLVGDGLLKGKPIDDALLPIQDAAGITRAVSAALPVAGAAEILRRHAREWSQERSDREAGERERTLADVEHWLQREQELRERFYLAIGEIDTAAVPARLPAARAQLDVCRAAVGRLSPRTKWLGEALLRALGTERSEVSAEWRGDLGRILREQNADIQAELGVIGGAQRTVYGELVPLSARTLDVRRLSYESPLEIVVALSGAAAGVVAVLNQILQFRANYKARNEADQAVRTSLEKQIAENELVRDACIELRKQLESKLLGDLQISEVEVLDDPDEDWGWPSDDE